MSETINVNIGGDTVSVIIEGGALGPGMSIANEALNAAVAEAKQAAEDATVNGGIAGAAAGATAGEAAGAASGAVAGSNAANVVVAGKANVAADNIDGATWRTAIGLGNVNNTSDANKPVSTAQQTALNSKASLAQLSASETSSNFEAPHPVAYYTFPDSASGWTAGNATLVWTAGRLTVTATSATPRIEQLSNISKFIDGASYPVVVVDIENTGASNIGSDVRLLYFTAGHGFGYSNYVSPLNPAAILPGERRQLVFDARKQTVGPDWLTSQIQRLRLDALGTASGAVFVVRSVKVVMATDAGVRSLDRSRVPVVSLDAFGADPTGATNSDVALASAISAIGLSAGAVTGSACIQFGAGLYKFSAPIDVLMSAVTNNSLAIRGLGMNITKLQWTNTDGIRVTTNGERNSFQMSDLSLLTDTAGGSRTALKITNIAEFGGGSGNAFNIERVYIAGSDKTTLRDSNTKYWSDGAIITAVSNINFNAVSIAGAGLTGLGRGITYQGDVPRAIFAVICTLTNCLLYALDVGFTYGSYVQGVHITNTNFVNGNYGIVEAMSAVGSDQLIVMNCQFNTAADQILLRSMTHAIIKGNLFFVFSPNTSALSIQQAQMCIIEGNCFNALGSTTLAGTNGIFCGSNYPNSVSIAQGNTFRNLAIGIFLSSGSLGWNVQANGYVGCTSNVTNSAGAANSIGVATQ